MASSSKQTTNDGGGSSSSSTEVPLKSACDTEPATALNNSSSPQGSRTTTPGRKPRRKLTVDDPILADDVHSVQRLVEYFIVVSSQPRWESNATASKAKTSSSPTGRSKEAPQPLANTRSNSDKDLHAEKLKATNEKIIQQSRMKKHKLKLGFRKRGDAESGAVGAIQHALSSDEVEESRQEVIAPPKPRGTWARSGQGKGKGGGATKAVSSPDDISAAAAPQQQAPPQRQGTEGNIHMDHETRHEHTFQPKITARYPPTDYQDNPLNPMVTQFCFPVGDVIVPSPNYELPRVHHFVLTNEKGRKIYGTCLTVHEEFEPADDDDSPWARQPNAPFIHSGDSMDGSSDNNIEVTMDDASSNTTTLYIPRCLCILSHWPYVQAFRDYLAQLYRLASTTDCMTAPLERYIMNLCVEIPAPPPGAYEVQVQILDRTIRFWAPPAKLPIAFVALPYRTLLECLDLDNILHVWYCLLLERKVLVVSSQHSLLTVACEIFNSLLFPLQWSHLFVPLLPRILSPMLDAPVPYLCGVTRDNWIHVQPFVNEETVVVDLDRNSVMFGQHTPALPSVPTKKWNKLRTQLQATAGHLFWKARGLEAEYRQFTSGKLSQWDFKTAARDRGDAQWNEKLQTLDHAFRLEFTPDSENLASSIIEREQTQVDRLQEAFLAFFVSTLKGYRKFLKIPQVEEKAQASSEQPPETESWMPWNTRRTFDRHAFIASQKPEYNAFLNELCATQQFDDFITKRLYTPDLPDLIFFDQSIDAKLNRSKLKLKKVETPFLNSAKTHKVLKTFEAVPPNEAGLPQQNGKTRYMYKTWPDTFDASLFCPPRPIPSMITAEFDRQTALVSRLRAAQFSPVAAQDIDVDHSDINIDLMELYASEYDASPDSMAFTVFFFTYSAVIGREWQDYQVKRRQMETEIVSKAIVPTTETSSSSQDTREGTASDVALTDVSSYPDTGFAHEMSTLSIDMCDPCPNPNGSSSEAAVSHSVFYRTITGNGGPSSAHNSMSQMSQSDLSSRQQSLLDEDNETLAEYEEARDVAAAQLDLAFDALRTMEGRGLNTDPDVFKSLMEACGRCGDQTRALELIQTMKKEGLVADKEILSYFVATFSHTEENCVSPTALESEILRQQSKRRTDAYSAFLKRRFDFVGGLRASVAGAMSSDDEYGDGKTSDIYSESGSEYSGTSSNDRDSSHTGSFLDWIAPGSSKKAVRPKRRRRKRRTRKSKHLSSLATSDRLKKQIVLGESLLEFLYPDLIVDTSSETCPQCSQVMKEDHIVAGWKSCAFQDYTTGCPTCKHRFVPRFSVSCSADSFVGAQGPGTPLFCEFLSPWVMRKELNHVMSRENGIDLILDPAWRNGNDIKATLWWNLIVLCKRQKLPFAFLLQGSFQNRLINPVPQD